MSETAADPQEGRLGAKGRRTRASLVEAARAVFAEKGYFDTRLSDITDRAGCSTGTLYTYFRNREEVLAAIIESAQADVITSPRRSDEAEDPVTRIERANREYIEAYAANADLMALMDQVSHVDAGIRQVRRRRADAFIDRNARSIRRLQDRGAVDDTLDPLLVSQALSSMVSRLCFMSFVDPGIPSRSTPAGLEELVRTVSQLWVNALGLRRD